ncbi:hypothetical protein V6N13_001655 [Hibiscus sabdariffa]
MARIIWFTSLLLESWNDKKVAELWGTFESLGENVKHIKDCEKVSVLIVTNEEKRIEGLVEVEAGNMVHVVRVSGISFKDESVVSEIRKACDVDVEQNKSETSSISLSESSKTPAPESEGR